MTLIYYLTKTKTIQVRKQYGFKLMQKKYQSIFTISAVGPGCRCLLGCLQVDIAASSFYFVLLYEGVAAMPFAPREL